VIAIDDRAAPAFGDLPMRLSRFLLAAVALITVAAGASAPVEDLATRLRQVDSRVLSSQALDGLNPGRMLADDARARRDTVNRRESRAWNEVNDRAGWERFRDVRIRALRESLGTFPAPPKDLKVRVTRTLEGDGYRIDNLVFESRPGLFVTANLYRPEEPLGALPGILICHSHHAPKTQGELQDMGMAWARSGCLVLVMDLPGHGERRTHPFVEAGDYPRPFRVGRQDYFFRYNTGIQLALAGESLIGWIVWDLQRGVDLLLSRPGIDRDRIILLGAVAGGGDPSAVAAALHPRIAGVVPFNFGGPQPETVHPLPDDAEDRFNYAGSGSWESTRNLRLSARDGFLPWVIVGSVAPRRLIYAHEFAWDRDRDPVWRRLETIFRFYEARDHLGAVHGEGSVSGTPPGSTHCTNIGPIHLQQIDPLLQHEFNLLAPDRSPLPHHSAADLACLTPEIATTVKPLFRVASDLADDRLTEARRFLGTLAPEATRQRLRNDWARLLGRVEANREPRVISRTSERIGPMTAERIVLEVEPRIVVPLLLLLPEAAQEKRCPVVVGLAQGGKRAFLHGRPEFLARLLDGGAAVCLPDLRGTGETRPGDDARGRTGPSTAIASTELMLGETLLGARLRDLRAVLGFLRRQGGLDADRLALWGEGLVPANPPDRTLAVPHEAEPAPALAEPLGGILAMLGALFEDDIRAVVARGGLSSYRSLLDGPYVAIPFDTVVPGVLTTGDLADLAASLAPRPLRIEGLVDGLNRKVSAEILARTYAPALQAYERAWEQNRLRLLADEASGNGGPDWLLAALRGDRAPR
jgi:dienelactone hydrolase